MSVRTGPVRWGGPGALLLWVVGRLLVAVAVLVYTAVCRPRTAAALCGLVTVWWLFAVHPVATVFVAWLTGGLLHAWSVAHPASFRRQVRLRVLAWCRSVLVYRRHWSAAMTVAELADPGPGGALRLPRLGRVRCLDDVDVVQVRALLGQRGQAWEDAGPMLAHVFGARDVRVHRGDDRRLTLELLRGPRGSSWNRAGVLELEGRS